MLETATQPSDLRTLSFLTGDGDTTYGWTAADDAWVIPMIQKKMDEGYVFWIVRHNPLREARLRTAAEAADSRSVIIKDADARQLFEQGRIGIVSQPVRDRQDQTTRERRAVTAEEAASSDTVAHRPARGG